MSIGTDGFVQSFVVKTCRTITDEVQNGYKNFNVINLCNKFVESMNVDGVIKEKLSSTLSKLYTDCTNKYKAE